MRKAPRGGRWGQTNRRRLVSRETAVTPDASPMNSRRNTAGRLKLFETLQGDSHSARPMSLYGGRHAGSLEALRVARPEAVDLESIKDVMKMDVLRCQSPEMVEKEIWMHLLAYNLIRGVIVEAAQPHGKAPRQVSFKGALQTMTAFQDVLRQATAGERQRLFAVMLKAIAGHEVGNRPGRVEPRANKRRPKKQKYLTEPRKEARKRLLANGL
jgi:hypothetical protein